MTSKHPDGQYTLWKAICFKAACFLIVSMSSSSRSRSPRFTNHTIGLFLHHMNGTFHRTTIPQFGWRKTAGNRISRYHPQHRIFQRCVHTIRLRHSCRSIHNHRLQMETNQHDVSKQQQAGFFVFVRRFIIHESAHFPNRRLLE